MKEWGCGWGRGWRDDGRGVERTSALVEHSKRTEALHAQDSIPGGVRGQGSARAAIEEPRGEDEGAVNELRYGYARAVHTREDDKSDERAKVEERWEGKGDRREDRREAREAL